MVLCFLSIKAELAVLFYSYSWGMNSSYLTATYELYQETTAGLLLCTALTAAVNFTFLFYFVFNSFQKNGENQVCCLKKEKEARSLDINFFILFFP